MDNPSELMDFTLRGLSPSGSLFSSSMTMKPFETLPDMRPVPRVVAFNQLKDTCDKEVQRVEYKLEKEQEMNTRRVIIVIDNIDIHQLIVNILRFLVLNCIEITEIRSVRDPNVKDILNDRASGTRFSLIAYGLQGRISCPRGATFQFLTQTQLQNFIDEQFFYLSTFGRLPIVEAPHIVDDFVSVMGINEIRGPVSLRYSEEYPQIPNGKSEKWNRGYVYEIQFEGIYQSGMASYLHGIVTQFSIDVIDFIFKARTPPHLSSSFFLMNSLISSNENNSTSSSPSPFFSAEYLFFIRDLNSISSLCVLTGVNISKNIKREFPGFCLDFTINKFSSCIEGSNMEFVFVNKDTKDVPIIPHISGYGAFLDRKKKASYIGNISNSKYDGFGRLFSQYDLELIPSLTDNKLFNDYRSNSKVQYSNKKVTINNNPCIDDNNNNKSNPYTSLTKCFYEGEFSDGLANGVGFYSVDNGGVSCLGIFRKGTFYCGIVLYPYNYPANSYVIRERIKMNAYEESVNVAIFHPLIKKHLYTFIRKRSTYWSNFSYRNYKKIGISIYSSITSIIRNKSINKFKILKLETNEYPSSVIPFECMDPFELTAWIEASCGKEYALSFIKYLQTPLSNSTHITNMRNRFKKIILSIDILWESRVLPLNLWHSCIRLPSMTLMRAYQIDRILRMNNVVCDPLLSPSLHFNVQNIESLEVVNSIGRGAYGEVCRMCHKIENNNNNNNNNSLFSRIISRIIRYTPNNNNNLINGEKDVAVKMISKNTKKSMYKAELFIELSREITTMRSVKHENIVGFLGVCASMARKTSSIMECSIMSELGQVSLADVLHPRNFRRISSIKRKEEKEKDNNIIGEEEEIKIKIKINKKEKIKYDYHELHRNYSSYVSRGVHMTPLTRVSFCEDITRGLSHMHSNGIIHSDLKSGNVILFRYSNNNNNKIKDKQNQNQNQNQNPMIGFVCKLCDFGHSAHRAYHRINRIEESELHLNKLKIINNNNNNNKLYLVKRLQKRMCTFPWASPESLLGREISDYSDIWSMGSIFYEIITRRVPWKGFSHPELSVLVGYGEFTPLHYHLHLSTEHSSGECDKSCVICSQEDYPLMWEVMKKCWKYEGSERITMEEVLQLLRMQRKILHSASQLTLSIFMGS